MVFLISLLINIMLTTSAISVMCTKLHLYEITTAVVHSFHVLNEFLCSNCLSKVISIVMYYDLLLHMTLTSTTYDLYRVNICPT